MESNNANKKECSQLCSLEPSYQELAYMITLIRKCQNVLMLKGQNHITELHCTINNFTRAFSFLFLHNFSG